MRPDTPKLLTLLAAALLALLTACSEESSGGNTSNNNGDPVNNGVEPVNNGDPVNNGVEPVNNGVEPVNNGVAPVNNGEPVNNGVEPSNNGNPNNGDPLDIPVAFVEGTEEAPDAPDCVSGCGNPQDPGAGFLMLGLNDRGGLAGRIDGDTHRYTAQGGQVNGGDIDIYAINAPARAMVELWLTPHGDPESQLKPTIYVLDLFQLLTFNGDAELDVTAARTQLVFPWSNPLPVLVIVEHLDNYDNFPNGPFVGGEGYEYALRWSVTPFAPTVLAPELAPGGSLTASGALARPGDMHAWRFQAQDGAAPRLRVRPAAGADPALDLVAATMTSAQGSAEYGPANCADPGNGHDLDWSEETVEGGEYLFVVYDCNGKGGERFRYEVEVSAP
jgi:hypothetical protein